MKETEPMFKHDCSYCDYLGDYKAVNPNDVIQTRVVDLYFCGDDSIWTVIARYGNSGEEYMSGNAFAYGQSEPLTIAAKRAIKQGLLTEEKYNDINNR